MEKTKKQVVCPPIVAERVRRIEGGFSFIPHRFLMDGFFASLLPKELLLYFLLLVAGDRNGVSFYGLDAILGLLGFDIEQYMEARRGLMEKDLIAFDGRRYQVLSLPRSPAVNVSLPLVSEEDFAERDPATIRRMIEASLFEARSK